MSDTAIVPDSQAIVVDEVFPHAPALIWRVLTTGELMGRWLMQPTGFQPVVGTEFTYQTKPAGEWDGTIRCRVLEVIPDEKLAYAWSSGHPGNTGYGATLDTVVTFTLARVGEGTRLRLVHSGFATPRNDYAFKVMGEGWKTCFGRLMGLTDDDM